MKKYIHIKSLVPANISINGEKQCYSNVDLVATKDFYIAFFPSGTEKFLPCAISTYGNIYPQSIKKIPFSNNHYEIIYNPTSIPNKEKEVIILHKKYLNNIFTITNSNKSFLNINSNSFAYASTTDLIQSIEFKSVENFVIISGIINEEKNYLLIYNTKTHKILLESTFKKLEKTKNSIKALKQEKSLSGYGKVYEFSYSSKKLSEYNIYITAPSIHSTTPEITPQYFLESIKFKDFKTAKNYLDNQTILESHLINFFGEIDEVYYNGHSKEINYTILTDKGYKNFSFIVNNEKIVDIIENPLNNT